MWAPGLGAGLEPSSVLRRWDFERESKGLTDGECHRYEDQGYVQDTTEEDSFDTGVEARKCGGPLCLCLLTSSEH